MLAVAAMVVLALAPAAFAQADEAPSLPPIPIRCTSPAAEAPCEEYVVQSNHSVRPSLRFQSELVQRRVNPHNANAVSLMVFICPEDQLKRGTRPSNPGSIDLTRNPMCLEAARYALPIHRSPSAVVVIDQTALETLRAGKKGCFDVQWSPPSALGRRVAVSTPFTMRGANLDGRVCDAPPSLRGAMR
jgi:hypothetical protein